MRTGKCEDVFLQGHVHTLTRAHRQNRNVRDANQLSWHQFTGAYQMLGALRKDSKAFKGSGLTIWWPLLFITCFSSK